MFQFLQFYLFVSVIIPSLLVYHISFVQVSPVQYVGLCSLVPILQWHYPFLCFLARLSVNLLNCRISFFFLSIAVINSVLSAAAFSSDVYHIIHEKSRENRSVILELNSSLKILLVRACYFSAITMLSNI